MNALVITSLFPNHLQPDFGNFVFQRMAAFSRLKGNRVKAIAPIPYCPAWLHNKRWSIYRGIEQREIREGIEVFHPRYPLIPKVAMPFHGLLIALGVLRQAAVLHKRHHFDIVDGHYVYPDGIAVMWVAKALKLPVVLSARGSDINQFSQLKTVRPQIIQALQSSNRIISVCNALKDEMCGLGVASEKIDVIPNGIDATRFSLMERLEARKKLGIQTDDKIILAVGGLVSRKGHDVIIHALRSVLGKHPEAHLRIIGEGPERGALQAIVNRLGLRDRVQLMGHRPNAELSFWYNAVDVFCLASSREGWANVIMEAMACGTPVVATNVYGAPEIITTTKVGILVERDTEAIAKGLIEALGRDWDRREIREHVAARSWEVVAKEVQAAFHKAIG